MWDFCIWSCIISDWNELFCVVFCDGCVCTDGMDGKIPTGGVIGWWFNEFNIWCIGSTWSGALKSFLCWLRRCCSDCVWCWFFRSVCLFNGFWSALMAGFWCLGSEFDKTATQKKKESRKTKKQNKIQSSLKWSLIQKRDIENVKLTKTVWWRIHKTQEIINVIVWWIVCRCGRRYFTRMH